MYTRTRQYFETNLFHTFQGRPLSVSTARTAVDMNKNGGTQKKQQFYPVSCMSYSHNKQHVLNV
jgi:hypothetical protein